MTPYPRQGGMWRFRFCFCVRFEAAIERKLIAGARKATGMDQYGCTARQHIRRLPRKGGDK